MLRYSVCRIYACAVFKDTSICCYWVLVTDNLEPRSRTDNQCSFCWHCCWAVLMLSRAGPRPATAGAVYLHADREVQRVLQRSSEPQSGGSSSLSYQVVSTRVSNPGQGVVLAQEAHGDPLAPRTCTSPSGAKRSVHLEVTVDRPALLLTEKRYQPVVRLVLLVSQLRTAPYVLTESVELCFGFIYTAASSVFQLQQQLCRVRHLVECVTARRSAQWQDPTTPETLPRVLKKK